MSAKQDNTSATLRAIAVLEIIVRDDRPVSLTGVMSDVDLPKPTVYRILTVLTRSGLLLRERAAGGSSFLSLCNNRTPRPVCGLPRLDVFKIPRNAVELCVT